MNECKDRVAVKQMFHVTDGLDGHVDWPLVSPETGHWSVETAYVRDRQDN